MPKNGTVLTAEDEAKLLKPIDDRLADIQAKIDALRVDGTNKVVSLQSSIDATKTDKLLSKGEQESLISGYKAEM